MTDRTGDRDELSQRLRGLRRAAGLSTTAVAALLTERGERVSQAKVSRTENARVAAEPEFVARLAQLYGASDEAIAELVRLATEIRKGNRRLVLGRDPAAAQTRFGRFQRQAKLIRAFTPTAVPGEMQILPYLRTVFDTEAAVRQRQINQSTFDDENAPRRYVLLMAEGALGWAPLPPHMMAEQVEHIAAMLNRRNVHIGIIPWGRAVPVLPLHSWYLFDDQLLVIGGETFALDISDPEDIAAYTKVTDELERLAVYGDEARAILARAADRYRREAAVPM